MKSFVIAVVCLFACGEKRNPDRCCVDEADCAAIGLPSGSLCPSGELCRGNECVEQRCSRSAECDPTAPYCENATCMEACSEDESCPGADQTGRPFCVAGSCAACRDSRDCGDRVCVSGTCSPCASDSECESGVCLGLTQTCAAVTEIAWADPSGSATGSCTKAEPCTLERALAVAPPRMTVKLNSGLYANTATLALAGKRNISGEPGGSRITNTGPGPVIFVAAGSEVSLQGLQIFGATNGAQTGAGIRCEGATLQLDNVELLNNQSDGIDAHCQLKVTNSKFKSNGGFGARLVGDTAVSYTVQRSLFARNLAGINARGQGLIENSFVVNNNGKAMELMQNGSAPQATRPAVNFVTVTGGIECNSAFDNIQIPITNVLYSSNWTFFLNRLPNGTLVCAIGPCAAGGVPVELDGITCANAPNLAFVNEANDDYHLATAGAPVTDGASGGVGLLDYDGESRPKGAGADIGADESQ